MAEYFPLTKDSSLFSGSYPFQIPVSQTNPIFSLTISAFVSRTRYILLFPPSEIYFYNAFFPDNKFPFPFVVKTSLVRYESTTSSLCDLRARFEAFLIANICSSLVCDNSPDVHIKRQRTIKRMCFVFFIYSILYWCSLLFILDMFYIQLWARADNR
jgi:hypothetical protein